MKFFLVAAALLVASVAGQSLDVDESKLNKEPITTDSLVKFDRPLVSSNVLGKRLLGHPLERFLTYGQNIEIPSYLRDDIYDVNVLQFEDVITHPLFRQYITLPLFRQYWSYPMFQRYVCSVYFQRFWHVPSFQNYFVDPVLFYKYIYPLVTLFKTDVSSTYGDYLIGNRNTYPYNYNYIYGQQSEDVRFPSIYRTGDYDQVYYRNLFNKLYNQLIFQQGGFRDIYTDVQTTPEELVREQTLGQIVDPVRFSFGDAKYTGEQIIPFVDDAVPEQYNYQKVNPLVARLLQGYNYRF